MTIFKDWTFKWWQAALLKICLLSAGILLGTYFYNYLIELTWLWWTLFALTGVYLFSWFFKQN